MRRVVFLLVLRGTLDDEEDSVLRLEALGEARSWDLSAFSGASETGETESEVEAEVLGLSGAINMEMGWERARLKDCRDTSGRCGVVGQPWI